MLTMFWQSLDVTLKEESPTLAASVVEGENSSGNGSATEAVATKREKEETAVAGILYHANGAEGGLIYVVIISNELTVTFLFIQVQLARC